MHSTGRFTCHKPLFRNHPEFVYQQSDHNWLIHTLIIFNLFMVLLEVYLLASFILKCAFEAFINLPGISKISLFLPLRCESPRSFGPSKPWRPPKPKKLRSKAPRPGEVEGQNTEGEEESFGSLRRWILHVFWYIVWCWMFVMFDECWMETHFFSKLSRNVVPSTPNYIIDRCVRGEEC